MSLRDVKISHYKIGKKHPVFVMAEAGINHNGSFSLAKKMVILAKKAGAHCIKFQTHIVEKEMIDLGIKPGPLSKKTLWEIIKNCELSEIQEKKIQLFCKEKKILFLSTPFSKEAVDRLAKIHVPAYKIGSGELTNLPLLHHIASKKKPVILSTGMSTMSDIRKAVKIFKTKKIPLVLLQTTSTYPSQYHEIKLGLIKKLQKLFDVPVGISDHSPGIYIPLGAVAKGACIIEKHFTLDKNLPGPDHKASIDFAELKELVKGCKAVKLALGGSKQILKNEKPILKFARASVVSTREIKKGEILLHENIATKRPGTGLIPATKFYQVLGHYAKRRIRENKQLSWKDMF